MPDPIGEHSVIVASRQQTSCDLDEEAVVLHLASGDYFGLNDVATVAWGMLQRPTTFADLRQAVLSEFDVAPDRCEGDLRSWLSEMAAAGLVEISGEEDQHATSE